MNWTDRVVRLAWVKPDDLLANPFNYRVHPRFQQDALEGSIDENGFSVPPLVQQGTDRIIDGHLRVSLAMRHNVPAMPVVYLDVTDVEANSLLATIDPLVGLAGFDHAKFQELLEVTPKPESTALMELLAKMAQPVGEAGDVGETAAADEQEREPSTHECPACGHVF